MAEIHNPAVIMHLEQRMRVRARTLQTLCLALIADDADWEATVEPILDGYLDDDVVMDQNQPSHPITKADMLALKAIQDSISTFYAANGNAELFSKFAVSGP